MTDTGIVDKAVMFAVMKHSGTARKGTKVPYIVHPMEAAAIVAGITDDQRLIAAAALHDTLEDTYTSREELEDQFGPYITELVAEESEDKQKDLPAAATWKERKQITIDRLGRAGYEVRLVALADKLANIRAIQRDDKVLGEELWKRFNQKEKKEHGWYYGSLAKIFLSDDRLKDTQACREYAERVNAVFGTASEG